MPRTGTANTASMLEYLFVIMLPLILNLPVAAAALTSGHIVPTGIAAAAGAVAIGVVVAAGALGARDPSQLTIKEIRQQVRELGATQDQIDDAADSDDQKDALTKLLRQLQPQSRTTADAAANTSPAAAAQAVSPPTVWRTRFERFEPRPDPEAVGGSGGGGGDSGGGGGTLESSESSEGWSLNVDVPVHRPVQVARTLEDALDTVDVTGADSSGTLKDDMTSAGHQVVPGFAILPAMGSADIGETGGRQKVGSTSDWHRDQAEEVKRQAAVAGGTAVVADDHSGAYDGQDGQDGQDTSDTAQSTPATQMQKLAAGVTHKVDLVEICDVIQATKEQSSNCQGSQVVFAVGRTGAGKSTTINFLFGKTVEKGQIEIPAIDDDDEPYFEEVLKVNDPLPGSEVGHQSDAQTKHVSGHCAAFGEFVLCDTPGFDDTDNSKGCTTDVANSIAMFHTICSCKTVRLFLIVDANGMLSGRGGDLKKLLQLMNRFVTDDCLDAVLVGFSHWPNNDVRKLKGDLSKLVRAEHIKGDASQVAFLKHMIKLLGDHGDALILHPHEDDPSRLLTILEEKVKPIQDPGDIFKLPLSLQSQAELLAGCQSLALQVKELLQKKDLRDSSLSDAIEMIETLASTLNVKEVSDVRAACVQDMFAYCSEAIMKADAALAGKKIGLLRDYLDMLNGYDCFQAVFGDKWSDLRNSRQKLIKKLDALMKELADINDGSRYDAHHEQPDYNAILNKLDLLQSICVPGPSSLLPYLVDGTSNLHNVAVDKVRNLGTHLFKLAQQAIQDDRFDSDLGMLMGSLGHHCTKLSGHTVTNTYYEVAKADLCDKTLTHGQSNLTLLQKMDEFRCVSWNSAGIEQIKYGMEKMQQALKTLPHDVSEELETKRAECQHQLDQLTNSLFADADQNLTGSEDFAALGVTMSNIVSIEHLVGGDCARERREQKCKDVEQRLQAMVDELQDRLKVTELRADDCQHIGVKLHAVRDAIRHMQSVISPEHLTTLVSVHETVTRNLDEIHQRWAHLVELSLPTDAAAVFGQLAQIEYMHAAALGRHATGIPQTAKQMLETIESSLQSLGLDCLTSSKTTSFSGQLESIATLAGKLDLLKTYVKLFRSKSSAFPSLTRGEDFSDSDSEDDFSDCKSDEKAAVAGSSSGGGGGGGGAGVGSLRRMVSAGMQRITTRQTAQPRCAPLTAATTSSPGGFQLSQKVMRGSSAASQHGKFDVISAQLGSTYEQCQRELAQVAQQQPLTGDMMLSAGKYQDFVELAEELDVRRVLDVFLPDAADGGTPCTSFEAAWISATRAMKDTLKASDDQTRYALNSDDMDTARTEMESIEKMLAFSPHVDNVEDTLNRLQTDWANKRGSFTTRVNAYLNDENWPQLAQLLTGTAALDTNLDQQEYGEARDQVRNRIKSKYEAAVRTIDHMRGQKRDADVPRLSTDLIMFEKIGCLGHEDVLGGIVNEWQRTLSDKLSQQIGRITTRGNDELFRYKICNCLTIRDDLEQFTCHFPGAITDLARSEAGKLEAIFVQKMADLSFDVETAVNECDCMTLDDILNGCKDAKDFDTVSVSNSAAGQFTTQTQHLRNILTERLDAIKSALDEEQIEMCHVKLTNMMQLMKSQHVKDLVSAEALPNLSQDFEALLNKQFTRRELLNRDRELVLDALRQFKAINTTQFTSRLNAFVDQLKGEYSRNDTLRTSDLTRNVVARFDAQISDLTKFQGVISPVAGTHELSELQAEIFDTFAQIISEGITATKRAKIRDWPETERMQSVLERALPTLEYSTTFAAPEYSQYVCPRMQTFWQDYGEDVHKKGTQFMAGIARAVKDVKTGHNVLGKMNLEDPTSFNVQEVSSFLTTLRQNDGISVGDDEGAEDLSYACACGALKGKIQKATARVQNLRLDDEKEVVLVGRIVDCLSRLSEIADSDVRAVVTRATTGTAQSLRKKLGALGEAATAAYQLALRHSDQKQRDNLNDCDRLMTSARAARAILQKCSTAFGLSSDKDATVVLINEATEANCKAFLQQLKSKLPDVAEVAVQLVSLYTVPAHISDPIVKECMMKCINEILDSCRSGSIKFSDLATTLNTWPGSLAKQIVEDFPQFMQHTIEQFNIATSRVTPKGVLAHIKETHKLKDERVELLDRAFKEYEAEFERLWKSNHLTCDTKAMAALVSRHAREGSVNLPKLIAGIFAVWSLSSPGGAMRPHPCQVFSLFRLLGIDQDKGLMNSRTMFKTERAAAVLDSRHLIELKTGEGKSVVLGVLSTALALLGNDVDCVCYSKHLSSRDSKDFAEIFAVFQVQEHVWYGTFGALTEKRLEQHGAVRDLTEALFDKGTGTKTPKAQLTAINRPPILLIDEVDVFLMEDFYGATYNPIAMYRDGHMEQLQRYIWDQRRNSVSQLQTAVQDQPFYQVLLANDPALAPKFQSAVHEMIHGCNVVMRGKNRQYRLKNGRIGYEADGTISTSMYYGYQTLYAYMKEAEAKNVSADVIPFGMQLDCGHYSYAEIPNTYAQILGVTGTLNTDCLGKMESQIIKDEYKIRWRTYMMSIYGPSNIDWKELEHIHVEENLERQHQMILKECLHVSGEQSRATLVVFEDESQLNAFHSSGYMAELTKAKIDVRKITVATDNIEHHVKRATDAKTVTLLTRTHGRGLDFKCRDEEMKAAGGVHVVQAFLSEAKSEEVQIRGRTARQGQRGSYKLVLDSVEICKHFGVEPAELAQQLKGSGVYAFLDQKRREWYDAKNEKRSAQVAAAKQHHGASQRFLASLVQYSNTGSKAARQECLRFLVEN